MNIAKQFQKTKKITLGTLALSFIFFILSGSSALAANPRFYLSAPSGSISPNSEFNLTIYLDTTISTNALNVEIGYPKEQLQFLNYNNTGSIVDLWQTQPKVLADGNIGFSGGILKGWSGKKGVVMNLSFRALKPGDAKIVFVRNDLYLADGKGTKLSGDVSSAKISISENAKQVEIVVETPGVDQTPPDLTMQVVRNPKDGVMLVVFNSNDRESGVKNTQIRFKKWFYYGAWFNALNPVVYPKGVWQIELKTLNNAGLENHKFYSTPSKLIYKLVMLLFLVIFLVYVLKRVYNKRSKKI